MFILVIIVLCCSLYRSHWYRARKPKRGISKHWPKQMCHCAYIPSVILEPFCISVYFHIVILRFGLVIRAKQNKCDILQIKIQSTWPNHNQARLKDACIGHVEAIWEHSIDVSFILRALWFLGNISVSLIFLFCSFGSCKCEIFVRRDSKNRYCFFLLSFYSLHLNGNRFSEIVLRLI